MPLLFIAMQNSKTPLSIAERGFLRCLAELNRSNWFCRPVPNLPAQAPFGITKVVIISENAILIQEKLLDIQKKTL